MHSQFSHIGNFQVEMLSLGMGSFKYSIMPPKPSSQGKFYSLTNFNNYQSQQSTDQHNMINADVRYRMYGVIDIPSNSNAQGYKVKSLTYSFYNESQVKNDVAAIIERMNQENIWNDSYIDTLVMGIHFSNDELLQIQPTIININNQQVQGVFLSAGGDFITSCTRNAFQSWLVMMANESLSSHRDQLIIMYQNAQIQASLDALLVNNSIFAGVDYRNGATSIIGGNGNNTSSNMGNFNNNNNYQNQNFNSTTSNGGNFSGNFSQGTKLGGNTQPNNVINNSNPFGDSSSPIRPRIEGGSHDKVFGKVENKQQPKQEEPKVVKTSMESLSKQMNNNAPTTETTPKEEPKKEENKASSEKMGSLLAGFNPTGKFEDQASKIVKSEETEEVASDNPFEGTDITQYSSSDPFADLGDE